MQRFGKILQRTYKVMKKEEYLTNQKLAMLTKVVQTLEMPDLLAPDGKPLSSDEKLVLTSVPTVPVEYQQQEQDPLYVNMKTYKPDIVMLQYDPMHYLSRQRFVSHKLAIQNTPEYSEKGMFSIDHPVPLTWDECVINNVTLDIINQNKHHEQIELGKALTTFNYPNLQDPVAHEQLKDVFIQTINQQILGLQPSKYANLNQWIYTLLMGKARVVLCDMPEQLLRMQLGNTIPLSTLKEMFEYVIHKNNKHLKESGQLITMEETTLNYFPHVFQMPRDLYLTAFIKESFQAGKQSLAFVGSPHFVPIQRYWVGPPAGINWSQATHVPDRMQGESDEMLIEKQAIMDIMLDSKAWAQKYLTNPFPYLRESLPDYTEQDLKYYKGYFLEMYHKYSNVRNNLLKVDKIEQTETKKISQQTA